MIEKRMVTDLKECQTLWEGLIRPKAICDLWEFRACFQRHFKRDPSFLVLEDRKGIAAMLPLSYIREEDLFVFFPGEIWRGKTWLERNPIYLRDRHFLEEILLACPERTYLRYMDVADVERWPSLEPDETGYVLYPAELNFDITAYCGRFSSKRLKSIRKTIHEITAGEGFFRVNALEDFNLIVDLNVGRFGPDSYIYNMPFRESFRDVLSFLKSKGWLRMVTLEVHGQKVAVDLGALYRGHYTVFLGGTSAEFPGIAKAMNMHHIEFAFANRLKKLDFLCGDFHWKKLWHLDVEPLYKFLTPVLMTDDIMNFEKQGPFGARLYQEHLVAQA
jgi:hypothetical protein